MAMRWWYALLGALLAVFLTAGGAQAQSTGGSFGGGNFGGSGSSGSSSGSSGSSGSWGGGSSSGSGSWGGGSSGGYSSSNDYGSGSNSSSGRGKGMGLGGVCCFLMFFGGIIGLVLLSKLRGGKASAGAGPAQGGNYSGPDAMHVNRLSLGIDWRARRDLQETLKRLAETGDTQSPQGLAHLLRETVLALRRAEMSWLFVAQENLGSFRPQEAQQKFQMAAMKMRAAFQKELVRGAAGQVQTQDTPEMQARATEGEGTVVVHLIIAAKRALPTMANPDANQIRMGLDNRAAITAQQLVALEVVWSPAAENDRMSSAELEQFYPDMRLIDPMSIAGRLFCTYCQGPFAMELLTCPHCGAPAEKSQGNRAPRGSG